MIWFVLAWILAALVATVIGSVASTVMTLNSLDLELTLNTYFTTAMRDLVGFGPNYAAMIAGAMLPLFLLAAGLARVIGGMRGLLYLLGGAAAPVAVVLGLQGVINQPVIFGASTPMGLAAQALAGAFAGLVASAVARPGAAGGHAAARA